jgi:hypothetical protein
MPNTQEKTNCYTYKVELTCQILAKDEFAAVKKLDTEGGYVTSRIVTLEKTTPLVSEKI